MADVKHFSNRNGPALVSLLQRGAIGVLKTDTIYGIVTVASNRTAVERLCKVRRRPLQQRSIILIASQRQMFSVVPPYAQKILRHYWPGKVSIELPIDKNVPEWLHCGEQEVSYRMPDDEELRQLLEKTGPLIAPSANLQGEPPACSITEAEAYFGDRVDFYVDSGVCDASTPFSQLLRVNKNGTVEKLR